MMMDSAFSKNLQENKLTFLNVMLNFCMLYVYTTRRYFLKVMLHREFMISSLISYHMSVEQCVGIVRENEM